MSTDKSSPDAGSVSSDTEHVGFSGRTGNDMCRQNKKKVT